MVSRARDRCARPSSGGCSTSWRRKAARSTSSSRRSSPPTRSATRTRSSGSSISSGRPTSSTGPSSGSSARIRSTVRRCGRSTGSIGRCSAKRVASLRSPATSPTGCGGRRVSTPRCWCHRRSSWTTGSPTGLGRSSSRSGGSTARSGWISSSRPRRWTKRWSRRRR